MGDKVKIKVVAANLTKRQLDYQWLPDHAKTATADKPEKEGKPVKATKSAKPKPRKK
jgi:ribonuclease R